MYILDAVISEFGIVNITNEALEPCFIVMKSALMAKKRGLHFALCSENNEDHESLGSE